MAALQLIEAIAEVAPKVRPAFFDSEDEKTDIQNVRRFSKFLIAPEDYSIRMTDAPVGEESRSLILAILTAGSRTATFLADSVKQLRGMT